MFATALLLIIGLIDDRNPPWTEFKSTEGGYTIRMPAGAVSRSEKAEGPAGEVEIHSLSADEDGLKFVVYHHDLPVAVPAARRAPFLDAQRDGLVRSNQGAIRTESKLLIDGKPARDLILDVAINGGGAAILRARLVLADRRVYQFYAWAPEKKSDRPEIAEFFDSFHILSARELVPGTPFSPSTAGFSVIFPGLAPVEAKERIGDRDWTIFESKDAGTTFLVARSELPESSIKDPRRTLDLARDALVSSTLGGALTSERKLTLGRHPARELVVGIPLGEDPRGAVLTARIVLVGRKLYEVITIALKENKDVDRVRAFLDSFKPDAAK